MPKEPHKKLHPREQTEETRRNILAVAERLFFEYGYRVVTTRQVAQECGITQPALYYHFSDKQALYVAVLEETLKRMKVALEQIAFDDKSTVEERLVRLAYYLLHDTKHDMRLMFHDIQHELNAETQQKVAMAFEEGLLRPIVVIFEAAVQPGIIQNQAENGFDPATSAYLFLNLVTNFIQSANSSPTPLRQGQSELELARMLTRLHLYGLVGVRRMGKGEGYS